MRGKSGLEKNESGGLGHLLKFPPFGEHISKKRRNLDRFTLGLDVLYVLKIKNRCLDF